MKESAPIRHRIVILASGRGSNAQAIIDYLKDRADLEFSLIITNNFNAGVIDLAREEKIPVHITTRKEFYHSSNIRDMLKAIDPSLIILAGYLWLIPADLIAAFPDKILNIHPALLPNYGGKGMFGQNVHEAVKASGDKISGITIHRVDEQYDHGHHILQREVNIEHCKDPSEIAAEVLRLEHYWYPRVVEEELKKQGAGN